MCLCVCVRACARVCVSTDVCNCGLGSGVVHIHPCVMSSFNETVTMETLVRSGPQLPPKERGMLGRGEMVIFGHGEKQDSDLFPLSAPLRAPSGERGHVKLS